MISAAPFCSSSYFVTARVSPPILYSCHGLGCKTLPRSPSFGHRFLLSSKERIGTRPGINYMLAGCSSPNKVNQPSTDLNVPQLSLWALEGVYIIWLFFLPFAPGDPVWSISSDTISQLLGLSLNFFFILPLANSGFMSEGLFNFVIGWTFMFAPLLFTDCRRDRFKGSLDVLWGLQMFLTNAFLIPYMAIRLDEEDTQPASEELSKLGSLMTKGAPYVGLIGGAICLASTWWAISGRGDGGFGSLADRWEFLKGYVGSERLAYAFIWDIGLYTIFQPWLIGDNIEIVREDKKGLVGSLRFMPVFGLVAYLLFLDIDNL